MAVGALRSIRDTGPLGLRRVYGGVVPDEETRRRVREDGRAREITEDFLDAVARLDSYMKNSSVPGELIVSPVGENQVDIAFRVKSYMGDGHSEVDADSFSLVGSIAEKLKIDQQVREQLSAQEVAEKGDPEDY